MPDKSLTEQWPKVFRMYRRGDLSTTHNSVQANAPDEPQFEGVVFSDGKCAIRWLTGKRSVAVWDCFDDMMAIHGHPEYNSELVWERDSLHSQDIGLTDEEIINVTEPCFENKPCPYGVPDTDRPTSLMDAFCDCCSRKCVVEVITAKASLKIAALEEENRGLREQLAQAMKADKVFIEGVKRGVEDAEAGRVVEWDVDSLKEQEG